MQLTEQDIIEGLKYGDSRVLNYLVERYYSSLQYFTYKIISEWEDAQDIVVQTFNSFWNLRSNFDSEKNIRAFLYITARNRCLNYLRDRERRFSHKKEYKEFLLQIENDNELESRFVQSDLIYKIYLEVQKLPEKYRSILFLTYFKGMSINEIASELNISISNVTTRRARALNMLKLNLKDNREFRTLIVLISTYHIVNPGI